MILDRCPCYYHNRTKGWKSMGLLKIRLITKYHLPLPLTCLLGFLFYNMAVHHEIDGALAKV